MDYKWLIVQLGGVSQTSQLHLGLYSLSMYMYASPTQERIHLCTLVLLYKEFWVDRTGCYSMRHRKVTLYVNHCHIRSPVSSCSQLGPPQLHMLSMFMMVAKFTNIIDVNMIVMFVNFAINMKITCAVVVDTVVMTLET